MTMQSDRTTGRELNKRWQVGAKHALYRADGKWYHVLTSFPAALFDASGYIMFEREEDYRNCSDLSISEHVHVTNGIAAIPGYIQVVYDKPQPRVLKEQQEQYEESVPADEASLDDKSPEQFSFIDQHGARSPSEIVPTKSLNEGAIRSVQVNAYERNSTARAQCIRHYGSKCSVCDFDFERMYGPIGQDFIHVHHIIPIATIGKQYQVDPLRDLIPVCPNCHAMLHRTDPPLTVEELQSYIRR